MRAGPGSRKGTTRWSYELVWLGGRLLRKGLLYPIPRPLLFAGARFWTRDRGQSSILENVRGNIQASVGRDRTSTDVQEIVRDHSEFMGNVPLWRILSKHPRFQSTEHWPVRGVEYLRSAVERGKGTILLTAHFGLAQLIPFILEVHGISSIRVIADLRRLERRRKVEEWLSSTGRIRRSLFAYSEIFPVAHRASDLTASLDIRPVLSALSRNQVLVVAGDGLRATSFVKLPLLERTYPFPTGFMKIALMTGAEVFPAFALPRKGDRLVELEIGDRLPLDSTKTLSDNVELYARILDDRLRRDPHLYLRWANHRWFESAIEWVDETSDDPFKAMPSWASD